MRHGFHGLLGGGVERQRLVGPICLGERDLLIRAVDRTCRSEQQVLGPHVLGKLQHIPRPNQVGVDICLRILEAVANARLGGEVKDHLGLGEIGGTLQRLGILQHRSHRLEAVGTRKNGVARLLQLDVVIGVIPSKPTTSLPSSNSRRARWNPMKPAVPVIR